MTPRSLTEAEVRHIVERTVSGQSGRKSTANHFQLVDIPALQRDLTNCAGSYPMVQRVKAKGDHTSGKKRAEEIQKAARRLLDLISDDIGRRCVGEFSYEMKLPSDIDLLDMDVGGAFDRDLMAVYLNHLQAESNCLLAKIEFRQQGLERIHGSAVDWFVGVRLAHIFKKSFKREAGVSKHRTVKADGSERALVDGPFVRFVHTTLDVLRQSHGIELQLQPNTIADALKTARNGGVRKRAVKKPLPSRGPNSRKK